MRISNCCGAPPRDEIGADWTGYCSKCGESAVFDIDDDEFLVEINELFDPDIPNWAKSKYLDLACSYLRLTSDLKKVYNDVYDLSIMFAPKALEGSALPDTPKTE